MGGCSPSNPTPPVYLWRNNVSKRSSTHLATQLFLREGKRDKIQTNRSVFVFLLITQTNLPFLILEESQRAHNSVQNTSAFVFLNGHFSLTRTPVNSSALFRSDVCVYGHCKINSHHSSLNSTIQLPLHFLVTFTRHISHNPSKWAQQFSILVTLNFSIGPSRAFWCSAELLLFLSQYAAEDHFRLLPEHKHAPSQLVSMETSLGKTDTVGQCFNKR